MRLTVGPLPSAVYWRRRAVVLGAVLLFVIVLAYSCTGSGKADKRGTANPTKTVLTPESGTPATSTAATPVQEPSPTGQATNATPNSPTGPAQQPVEPAQQPVDLPADGTCSDAELRVTPAPVRASMRSGETMDIRLRIKNVSERTCERDVGAGPQELYIQLGARRVWSSDTCNTDRSSDVRSFTPGFEREYRVSWNGRESNRCAGEVADGDPLKPGEYQVFARLGTKISAPVKLTVTD